MKRIWVILANLICVVCLLLFALTIVLWVRSIYRGDSVTYLARSGDGYMLRTMPHGVAVGVCEKLRDAVASYKPLPDGWSVESEKWGVKLRYSIWTSDIHSDSYSYLTMVSHPPIFEHGFLGFGWKSPNFAPPAFRPQVVNRYSPYSPVASMPPTSAVAIPFWFLLLVFAFLPALRVVAWRRRRMRKRRGQCPRCGYDLRATPDRCPECGMAVDAR